jgi:tyrosine-protein kinase Etk/Wzc
MTAPPPLSEPSLLASLTPLIRAWKLLLAIPLLAGVIAAGVAFVLPPSYTAATTFVPAVGGTGTALPGGLAGLATQFGISVGGSNSLSPDFFAEVLASRELLRTTLLAEFDDPERPGSGKPLLDLLKVRGRTPAGRIDNGIRQLERDISQRVDRRTGIVTLSVRGRSPVLAAAVANRMVELLNKFNLERLQSQSRERRRFAEERRDQSERELRDAEARQLRFLQSNRRFADSPLLSFEENRLARQVQLRQEVFQTLTREYEEARIAEVRDTPLLTIIDTAVAPDRRTFPQRKLIVFLTMVAAGLTTVACIYVAEYGRAAEVASAAEYRSFIQAWSNAKSEVRSALGRRR